MLCIMGNAQYYIHKVAHGRIESLCVFASKSIASSCSYFVVVVVVDLKITAEARRQRCVGRRYGETGQEAHREVCFVPKLVPTSDRKGVNNMVISRTSKHPHNVLYSLNLFSLLTDPQSCWLLTLT
ncbi:hypothetical protein HYC85_022239 [Camellia sinensis]|uniref:Uncharacterized protein n=1 Tax=Camellia sinensis TaxID=4442 RepID=A0A7J7GJT3_CAMSI|nr:hypothetical protein HYC85_022239 [Camellia sinensis]